MSAEGAPKKLLDVEALRAVAILFTLFAHYRFAYAEQPGWISRIDEHAHFWGGVDLFFVISGFVISKSLIPQFLSIPVEDKATRLKALLRFWMRRMFRLWPSSWLWAVLGLVIAAIWYPAHLENTVNDVMSAMLQAYNFHAWSCANGAKTCSHLVVGVYWSLSLEEQFYILLPVVFFVLRERARWAIGLMLFAGFMMSVVWPAPLGFFRWEGFCLGVLLAWAYATPGVYQLAEQHLVGPMRRFTVIVTVLMLLALPLIANGSISSAPYPLSALCSAVLVALAAFDKNYLGVPALLRRPLTYLGARSYSIYLVHVPVFVIFQRYSDARILQAGSGLPRWLGHGIWVGAATAAVLAVAELNFRFVESRFRLPSEGEPAREPLHAAA